MRDIKFRAWDKTAQKIFYGFAIGASCLSENALYAIMQFTGLHDKNNREVYEGDIVSVPVDFQDSPAIYYIAYWECSWLLKGRQGYPPDDFLSMFGASEVEIIGNIYENPELLEAK